MFKNYRSSLLQLFIDELSRIYEDLMLGSDVRTNPALTLVAGLALTVAASSTNNLLLLLLTAISSISFLLALGVELLRLIKPFTVATSFTLIVALPAIVNDLYKLGLPGIKYLVIYQIVAFILRVSVSTLALVGTVSYLGWMNIVRALIILRMPSFLTRSLMFFLLYIPIMARETVKMLAAREVRLIKSSRSEAWRILSTVVGDLILRSIERSQRLNMAIEARGFSMRYDLTYAFALNKRDYLTLMVILTPFIIYASLMVIPWGLAPML